MLKIEMTILIDKDPLDFYDKTKLTLDDLVDYITGTTGSYIEKLTTFSPLIKTEYTSY